MPRWTVDDDAYLQAQISELAGSVAELSRCITDAESALNDLQRELSNLSDAVDELIESQGYLGADEASYVARLVRLERAFAFLSPLETSE